MFEFSLPLWGDLSLFLGSAVAIGLSGVKLAGFADRLADRTGLGEAVTGTIFRGMITGLIYRQKHGPGNIGFESVLLLLLYITGFFILSFAM